MLILVTLGFGFANVWMLFRLWRAGRSRREALRDQIDTLSPSPRLRPHRRRD